MTQRLNSQAVRFSGLVLALVVAFGVFTAAKNLGWLSPFGIDSQSTDSQVVQAIERTEQVSLLSLGMQGIKEEHRSSEVFGRSIPGTSETLFLQYAFTAKLGIDGAKVKVSKTGDHSYLVSAPEFIFIGYDKPTFKVAAQDSGVLSWVTPDIDQLKMVSELFDDDARKAYIASNQDLLKEQTKSFYTGIITGIDPEAHTRFEFRD